MNKDKTSSPNDPISQNASVTVSSKSTYRTISKLLAEMVQPHRILQLGLQISLALSHYTETGQQMAQLALPGLDHYPNFLKVTKRCKHPQTT